MTQIIRHNVQEIGRGTPYRGKLVAMPTTNTFLQQQPDSDSSAFWATANRGLAIEFPAQPKTIELARSADYMIATSPFLPDGYHQYISTKPLEIPVSFELHSFDRTYCKQGALTLLQVASRLHSFILPIADGGTYANVPASASKTGQPAEAQIDKGSATQNVNWTAYGQNGNKSSINPPVTCWLHLVWVDSDLPGISCIGYLKEVKVVLNGPFLKGPNGSFNLPSSAEFSFTFVHHPGHNNDFGSKLSSSSSTSVPPSAQEGAFAPRVRDQFYNTRDLVRLANYQGLEDATVNTTPPPPETTPTVLGRAGAPGNTARAAQRQPDKNPPNLIFPAN